MNGRVALYARDKTTTWNDQILDPFVLIGRDLTFVPDPGRRGAKGGGEGC